MSLTVSILDPSDHEMLAVVERFYLENQNPELLCADGFGAPNRAYLAGPDRYVFLGYEGEELVGVLILRSGGLNFPCFKGDPLPTLRALVAEARRVYGKPITAKTDNQEWLTAGSEINLGVRVYGNFMELS